MLEFFVQTRDNLCIYAHNVAMIKPNDDLSKRIREARLVKGITQSMLASKVYCSRSLISRYESGKVEPTFNTICRISVATGKPLDWFAGIVTSK